MLLALLAVASYLSGEIGAVHVLLGYALGAVLLFRVAWAASGNRSVGLARFYPQFKGLELGNARSHPAIGRTLMLAIAIALLGVTATGIAIDRGQTLGVAAAATVPSAYADDDDRRERAWSARSGERRGDDEREDMWTELHEALAEILPLLIVLHAGYLLAFKRPLARFMLFADGAGPRRTGRDRAGGAPPTSGGTQPAARSTSSPPM
ncbi:MAG: cytochrome b/b6 domain-containing protein [Burkholderiales bacterium]|nr:MAG: cytochrome b/b6 domain-containing protein [Burkholderiales bacterium]